VAEDLTMRWEELLTSMGRFGFAEKEARLYLLILRRGRATARNLTRDARMDRVLAYRTLDAMRSRGIVQVTAERPRRYVAIAPKVLFDRSLFERRRALEEDVTLARELSEHLPELTESVGERAARFEVLTGRAAIYPYLREMVGRASASLEVMVTPWALRESARQSLYEPLPRFLAQGGRFRALVEPDPHVDHLVRRLRRAGRRFPNVEVRTLPEQRARLTLVDRREAIVFLVPEAASTDSEEIAVWTDHRDFVIAESAYFDAIWAKSTVYGGRTVRSG
jgi:sugar-specific transcriptional regulator TrmB